MKQITLFFTLLLMGSLQTNAQEGVELKKFGLGVSHAFNYLEYWDTDFPMDINKIHFVINPNNKLRIEPEISGGYNRNYADYWVYVGTGLFHQKQNNKLNILYGMRLGASFDSYSELNFHVAPAFGMEYFVGEQFSLGAEIQLKTGFNYLDYEMVNVALLAPISARFYFK